MSEYLSIQHIQKQFDAFTALKDISFTVKKMSLFVYWAQVVVGKRHCSGF